MCLETGFGGLMTNVSGSLFQAVGPEYENALSPNFERSLGEA